MKASTDKDYRIVNFLSACTISACTSFWVLTGQWLLPILLFAFGLLCAGLLSVLFPDIVSRRASGREGFDPLFFGLVVAGVVGMQRDHPVELL